MLITEAMLRPKTPTPTDKRQLQASKLRSQNLYLSALLQKKYRLELEIKRQQKVLKKTQTSSMKQLNESIQAIVKDFNPDLQSSLSKNQEQVLLEGVTKEELQVLVELDRLIEDSERTLKEIKGLKLDP